jgi:hypothetical protein
MAGSDTITESWTQDSGPQATVRFKCFWDDRYVFCQQLLGTWQGTPPNTVHRTPPFRYPPSPNLFCMSIDKIEEHGKPFIPFGMVLPWMARKFAIVTATFYVPKYGVDGADAYSKTTFACSGEFLTLPETTYRFQDGTPTNTPIGVMIPQLEITVTKYKLPFLPIAAMLALEGRVNAFDFQIQGVPFPAGTLLFMSGTSDYEIDMLGNVAYTQEYKFIAKPIPWNFFLHPNRTSGWRNVFGPPSWDGSGFTQPYPQGDLSNLP